MYSKILRALSLLLALIMLSAVAISYDKASTNEDPETDTQVEPTDESRDICVFPPDPDIDFEGEEITILIRDNILYSREWCKEEAEDELDEVIAMRDKEFSYKFDLNVKYELVPEAWGGDVICVPVSAKTKMNIDTLLESVLLVAEMKELREAESE